MRNFRRKNALGYTFLEVFLSLSIFGLILVACFTFFSKKTNQMLGRQDELLSIYEKLSPCIQKALRVRLSENRICFRLNGKNGDEWREVGFFSQKTKRKCHMLDFFVPKITCVDWLYLDDDKWERLKKGQIYNNISFLKLVLRDEIDVLEQFVFACHGMIFEE